ncbi:MAG: hypothetical protein ACK4HE_04780 [Chitinophagaceae bacterium]
MKQLFIIAPHFPPSSLPPSQRVRLLVRNAKQFGFFPHAYTVNAHYREETTDEWMNELLGNDYLVTEINCFDQRRTRKFGIGDLGLRMLPFLIVRLIKDAKKLKPDFILYPVPPWYILIAAPVVKWFTKVPYGIDFIDPWVHEVASKNHVGFKYKASQYIARNLEKWVCKNASVIFSVSEGINQNIKKRHSILKNKPMVAVAYGAEENDFIHLANQIKLTKNEQLTVRYIGAIWDDCYPVLDGLMPALAQWQKQVKFNLEMYGTTYAGEGLAKPQMYTWFNANKMNSFAKEFPLRVAYKKAVELTLTADILFLVGGMQPYYAASKLMGLIVSKKPFLAFVHQDSFPAKFLQEVNYPYVVTYSNTEDELPIKKQAALIDTFNKLYAKMHQFQPVDLTHSLVEANTAVGMTKVFLQEISKHL